MQIPTKFFSLLFLAFLAFVRGAYAQEKNISLDCDFPRGFQLDLFKDRHPNLFDASRLSERYAREGIPIPDREELEQAAVDIFLFIADLRIRSIEIDKDFGGPEWLNIDGSFVQLSGDEAEWTSSHLNYVKYMPAFSIHYSIDRSDLSFSANYRSFPPSLNEFILWRGGCLIVVEPERKF
jgi:hypothetical protein